MTFQLNSQKQWQHFVKILWFIQYMYRCFYARSLLWPSAIHKRTHIAWFSFRSEVRSMEPHLEDPAIVEWNRHWSHSTQKQRNRNKKQHFAHDWSSDTFKQHFFCIKTDLKLIILPNEWKYMEWISWRARWRLCSTPGEIDIDERGWFDRE